MRVLWLCHVVINDFADEFQIKRKPFAGWQESMLHRLEPIDNIDIALCFPIYDAKRRKDSVYNGHKYYSFNGNINQQSYDSSMSCEFLSILKDFEPDVIHIWGTEMNHDLAMVEACQSLGIVDKVVVRIQGMPSIYQWHYTLGIPEKYHAMVNGDINSIDFMKDKFIRCGKVENEIFRRVRHVISRSDWGEICVKQINPTVEFYRLQNIMRPIFYDVAGTWSIHNCKKHSIFIAQAHYSVKGFHYFLQALNMLCSKYKDIQVYIAGPNPFELGINDRAYGFLCYLTDLISEYELGNCLHFIDLLDEQEMVKALLRAHVTVCPSTIENRANSVVEAMMVGTPVVVSYVGGNVGMLEHGREGFFYPVDEFYMLAGYIDKIFSDDDLAESISKKAVCAALKMYNPADIVHQILKIYRMVTRE